MDRRVFLAVILTAIVIVVTPHLFPQSGRLSSIDSTQVDSSGARAQATGNKAEQAPPAAKVESISTAKPRKAEATAQIVQRPLVVSDSLGIKSQHMTVWYADQDASPLRVVLDSYQSRDTMRAQGPVILRTTQGRPLLAYGLSVADSTVAFSSGSWSGSVHVLSGRQEVEYLGDRKSAV